MDEAQLLKALDRDDSYRVVRTLAETSAGKTELVRGPGAGLLVRKYVPRELANERAWAKLREVNHPLLPQVRDLYWLPDRFVVVTTYVDGVTLGELVGSTGPLEPAEAVRYVGDLCEAASELHAHGIVHRDITPSNAVVAGGRAALIDLGNAHAHAEGANRDTTTLGTWGFAAPEQFGFAQTDARSDVYALGGLLAYLLTGVTPGDEGFDAALEDERLVPSGLWAVVQKARAFEPSARYQTAGELALAAEDAAPKPVVVPIDLDAPHVDEAPQARPAWSCAAAAAGEAKQPEALSCVVASEPERNPSAVRAAESLPMRIVRWFFPALPESRRTWLELRHLEKAFVVLLWGAALILIVPLSMGFFRAANGHSGTDACAYYSVSVIWTTALVLLVREVHLLVVCLGPGRNTVEAVKVFAIRVVVVASFSFALSVFMATICLAIGYGLQRA